ncbi:hypothetical protein ZOSMA_31G01560 [Zostera marina]|uniref:Pentatricopeptide repeat-containing protein n=1 Tax=Zostera marina TaxID=29655 RepID=A0A0K9P9A2_ZOSMR|nr:hypothetical protein ZOSMA_31G01560 [Zostera marina]
MHIKGLRSTSTTISIVLMACSRSSHMYNRKFVHGYILRNKICGHILCAEFIFKEMPKDNVVSWNVIMFISWNAIMFISRQLISSGA